MARTKGKRPQNRSTRRKARIQVERTKGNRRNEEDARYVKFVLNERDQKLTYMPNCIKNNPSA